MAREAKKQAKAQKPPTNTTTEANESTTTNTTEQSSNSNSSTNTGYFILGIGGLIVSGLGVYYQREAIMKMLGQSQKPAPAESNTVVEEPKQKGRIREME